MHNEPAYPAYLEVGEVLRRILLILAPWALIVLGQYAIALSGRLNPTPMPTPRQTASIACA